MKTQTLQHDALTVRIGKSRTIEGKFDSRVEVESQYLIDNVLGLCRSHPEVRIVFNVPSTSLGATNYYLSNSALLDTIRKIQSIDRQMPENGGPKPKTLKIALLLDDAGPASMRLGSSLLKSGIVINEMFIAKDLIKDQILERIMPHVLIDVLFKEAASSVSFCFSGSCVSN